MKSNILLPHTILCSFYYYGTKNMNAWPNFRIVGDSGAYSARSLGKEISVDELGQWVDKWRHRLFWVASLDIAGDQRTTRANWDYLNSTYNLQTVPSIHVGDDPRMLDYYAERGCDFVGLGGAAGGNVPPAALMRWLIRVFKYARGSWPGMRFHGWGMTMKMTQDLPFWSVDSSSWLSSVRFGQLRLPDPRTGKSFSIRLNGADVYAPQVRDILVNCYGFSPSSVGVSNSETRKDVAQLSALAALDYERRARAKHKRITAPKWGIANTLNGEIDGPMQVLANSDPNRIYDYIHPLTEGGR